MRRHGKLFIKKKMLLELIQALPEELPEVGGIIGGNNNEITEYWIDAVSVNGCMCKYSPNIKQINEKIEQWNDNKISFLGMFHTHYFGVRTLSKGDIEYMREIMRTMPSCIEILYFPIVVFPEKEMIIYAIKNQTMEIVQCECCVI